jgi:hypothetical protein
MIYQFQLILFKMNIIVMLVIKFHTFMKWIVCLINTYTSNFPIIQGFYFVSLTHVSYDLIPNTYIYINKMKVLT